MANPKIFNRDDYVRVTNGTDELIEGRFNGEDYEFSPGEAVDIHVQAATHIFAFGEDDKTRALSRLGWLRHSGELKSALARLAKIKFEDVPGIETVKQLKNHPRDPNRESGGTEGAVVSTAPEDPTDDEDDGEPRLIVIGETF